MACEGQRLELVDVGCGSVTAVWCDLMGWVRRRPPSYAEAERALHILTQVSQWVTSRPGLWVVTEPGCEIPSVSVRRMIASHLRLTRRLQLQAASIEGEVADSMLMRATMRAVAVAGGVRCSKIATSVSSVASELPEHFPGLGPAWGRHAVRVMRAAMERTPERVSAYGMTTTTPTGARAVLSAR